MQDLSVFVMGLARTKYITNTKLIWGCSNILILFIILQVIVIILKKLLTSVDANMHYNSNGPKNIPMFHNVMMVHWLQKCPSFSIARWETCVYSAPYSALIDFWSDLACTLGTWPFVDPFQFFHPLLPPFHICPTNEPSHCKKKRLGYLPAAYGLLIHTIILARISTPILYRNPYSPLNLNKEKGFPGMAGPFCRMHTSVPTTLMRQSFRLPLSFLLSKTILRE
jgi:hypothetical protein